MKGCARGCALLAFLHSCIHFSVCSALAFGISWGVEEAGAGGGASQCMDGSADYFFNSRSGQRVVKIRSVSGLHRMSMHCNIHYMLVEQHKTSGLRRNAITQWSQCARSGNPLSLWERKTTNLLTPITPITPITHSLTHSLHSLQSLTHSLTHSLHSLQSLTHSLTPSCKQGASIIQYNND